MGSTSSPHNPLSTPVIAIVVDSSITLASEWHHILNDYFPHLFERLTGRIPSSLAHALLGFVTYGPRDYDRSPVLVNQFFSRNALNDLMEDRIELAIGRTVAGVSTGMAALEGYASAIEMFDIFKNGINQKLLHPISLDESCDEPKEVFSYHLWHFAAGPPDDAQYPFWNSSPILHNLAWITVPAELKKRDINCSMLLVCPSPKFMVLFSAISDKPVTPWFPIRPHHTVLLSGFAPLPMAEAPSTIPIKRSAETPPEQLAPGPKVAKPSSPALRQQLASLALPQRRQPSVNNQMLQHAIQGQDPSQARQLMFFVQYQQQQNGSGFASRADQSLNPPVTTPAPTPPAPSSDLTPSGTSGRPKRAARAPLRDDDIRYSVSSYGSRRTPEMGHPQGQVSLQQSFVQPSPSVPPANVQSSSTPSTSQVPPPAGQQVPVPPGNFAEMSYGQLRHLHTQMLRFVMEGENSLQASSTTGPEADIQRQQFRAKLDVYKQRLQVLQEIITAKMRASGDPAQQAVNGASWPGPGQRPPGLYPAPERPGQHSSPSLHQASVNQAPPPRSIPTPHQNFVPSATAQSNLAQIPSHIPQNSLPHNGTLAQMAGATSQQSPQITHPPSQQPILPRKIPPLQEDRFKNVFMQYTAATGLRFNERDLVIEGRTISLWALHKAVFMRNGIYPVTTNNEWPIIGAALGFPLFSGGDGSQPARCGPSVAHRLRQIYNDILRQFDQAYINSVVTRMRASGQIPLQPQMQPYQPTEVDYQAFLASIRESSPTLTSEAMSIMPRFSHASGADLEAHRIPQHVIAFIEQNREHLKRAAHDQNGFRWMRLRPDPITLTISFG